MGDVMRCDAMRETEVEDGEEVEAVWYAPTCA
jgi:hypothetical protein